MTTRFLLPLFSAAILMLIPSCVDPNYYAGSSYTSYSSYSAMPHGYRTVHVSGIPYYYYGNSWYRRSGSRYVSCSRPRGYHGNIGRRTYHHGNYNRYASYRHNPVFHHSNPHRSYSHYRSGHSSRTYSNQRTCNSNRSYSSHRTHGSRSGYTGNRHAHRGSNSGTASSPRAPRVPRTNNVPTRKPTPAPKPSTPPRRSSNNSDSKQRTF